MIKSRYLPVVVALSLCFALAFSLALAAFSGSAPKKQTDYEEKLFTGQVISIDIQVAEEDWQNLLDNPREKEYISADLVIEGERFSSVGLRTKGNSSLNQEGDSSRYSLQLNPNKYVKGQSFYGLDSLSLNNLMGDATYMKDAIAYDIMEYLGVPAPRTNYASVTVNGEEYGLFLLLERYDDSFLDRVYNTTAGELYNVKMATGEQGGFGEGMAAPARQNPAARGGG